MRGALAEGNSDTHMREEIKRALPTDTEGVCANLVLEVRGAGCC